jgi:hypothetical protein
MYEVKATAKTPGHIVYVIDASGSMGDPLEGERKIDHVHRALKASISEMIGRSRTGDYFSPRYRVALIAYNDTPLDVFKGFLNITEVANLTLPSFVPSEKTDTRAAFVRVCDLLAGEINKIRHCPAPLVCHLTDARFTHEDPEPVVQDIMELRVDDGQVLVENIYLGDELTRTAIGDSRSWQGLRYEHELQDDFAQKLFRMSSPLPESYAGAMRDSGYQLAAGRRMLIPGTSSDLVEMAFTVSTKTGYASER